MKNLIFSLLFFVLSLQIIAQNPNEIGIRYGMGLNFISGDSTSLLNNRFTFLDFTGSFNHYFTNLFSIQPELQYYQTSFSYDNISSNVTNKNIFTQSYLGLSLLPKVNFSLKNGGVGLFTGPSFNYLIAASNRFEQNQSTITQSNYSNINKFLVNWIFGGSLLQNISDKNKLVLDARYNLGLTDVNGTTNKNKIHQMGFSIGFVRLI